MKDAPVRSGWLPWKPLGTDPNKPFLETAPWLICIFGERKSRSADGQLRKNDDVPESVSIAAGVLIVALHQAGLVTLTHTPNPMGFFQRDLRVDPPRTSPISSW